MLSINLRPAKIGNQISSQGETHGDDEVTAFRIPVKGVMLDERELCALLAEPLAYRALFVDKAGSPSQPLFNSLKPFGLKHKFDSGTVKFVHGIDKEEITFKACVISKITLEPSSGGMTELCFTVNTIPTLDAKSAHLLGYVNRELEIEVHAELAVEDAQQDLPLSSMGDGEEADQSDEISFPGRTRMLSPGQADAEAETERQLGEALRGLEAQQEGDAGSEEVADEKPKRGRGRPRKGDNGEAVAH